MSEALTTGERYARQAENYAECFDDPETVSALLDFAEIMRELQSIVDKLPKTADGVPVVPEQVIFNQSGEPIKAMRPFGFAWVIEGCRVVDVGHVHDIETCYSTREAATQAAQQQQD